MSQRGHHLMAIAFAISLSASLVSAEQAAESKSNSSAARWICHVHKASGGERGRLPY
jgi:hypothetical protein